MKCVFTPSCNIGKIDGYPDMKEPKRKRKDQR